MTSFVRSGRWTKLIPYSEQEGICFSPVVVVVAIGNNKGTRYCHVNTDLLHAQNSYGLLSKAVVVTGSARVNHGRPSLIFVVR